MQVVNDIATYIKNFEGYKDDFKPVVFPFNTDRCVIISDTHFGNPLVQNKVIDNVYNYIVKNGINSMLHAGDLIQGGVMGEAYNEDVSANQILKAYKSMPKINGLSVGLLLGNHDFYAIKYNPGLVDLYNVRNDIFLLGIKRCVLDTNIGKDNHAIISLNHYVKGFNSKPYDFKEDVLFHGHEHNYRHLERDIYIPSICDSDFVKDLYVTFDNLPKMLDVFFSNDGVYVNCLSLKRNAFVTYESLGPYKNKM